MKTQASTLVFLEQYEMGYRGYHLSITVMIALEIILSFTCFVRAQAPTVVNNPKPERISSDPTVSDTTYSETYLLPLLKNKDPQIRQSVALKLSELEKPSVVAIKAIVNLLADSSERVRFQALAGLMRLGELATDELSKTLSDTTLVGKFSYHSEAYNGGRYLNISNSDLAYAALSYAKTTDVDVLLSRYNTAPNSKTKPNAKTDIDFLLSRFNVSSKSVRERILRLLETVPVQVTPTLYKAIEGDDRTLAITAINMVGRASSPKTDAVPILSRIMINGSDNLRKAASFTLAKIPGVGITTLQRMLNSPNAVIRRYSLAAYPADVDSAALLIATFLKDPDSEVRSVALNRIQTPDFSESYFYARRSPCELVAKTEQLSKFWLTLPRSTVVDVLLLLKDASPKVRQSAIRTLGSLACIHPEHASTIADTLLKQIANPAVGIKSEAIAQLAKLTETGIAPRANNCLDIIVIELEKTMSQRRNKEVIESDNQWRTEEGTHQLLTILRKIKLPDTPHKDLIKLLTTLTLEQGEYGNKDVDSILMARPAWKDEMVKELISRYPKLKLFDYKALETLHHFKSNSPVFIQAFDQLLLHPDKNIRIQAAIELVELENTDRVLNVLQEGARSFEGYAGTYGLAADYLTNSIKGIERLIAIVEDPKTTKKTRNALLYYGLSRVVDKDKRVADLVLASAGDLSNPDQDHMIWALRSVKTHRDQVQTTLEKAFYSKNAEVRRAVAMVWAELGFLPDKLLNRITEDPVPRVRETVFQLLNSLPTNDSRLIDIINIAIKDTNQDVRDAALQFAGQLGNVGRAILTEYASKGNPLTYDFFNGIEKLRSYDRALLSVLELRKVNASQDVRTQIDDLLGTVESDSLVDRNKLYTQLQSQNENDRYSAAKTLFALHEDPWAKGGDIATVLMNIEVDRILRERLGKVLDQLYPVYEVLTSGRIRHLPQFPWPPPAGYQRVVVQRDLLKIGQNATLGTVYNKLVSTLETADKGFEHGLFELESSGFALVARMEHIESDGTPLPDPGRWIKDGYPNMSLLSFLGDLFFEKPGFFRIVVFAITDDVAPVANAKAQLPDFSTGAAAMPRDMAAKPFTNDQEVLALVYCFERRKNASIVPRRDGALSAQQHLIKAGVWAR
ncbi:HEAT repeat domain-containing protein [Fibrella aquatilis]|uniref:HEAT repeat domain-containing protein n=1 Tax=Fibrella aquatilis TaxID=2817059 RepID=A0A939GA10_9BACT|nr:HEAT repeat domain-containing protein [Fibrella aquatilis]MBO0932538.1 HEAT repeat domain-containing protein [Fibrella aquatilis]